MLPQLCSVCHIMNKSAIPIHPSQRQALILGTVALALSGLFSIVVAGARSPTGAFAAWFQKSLVLHVDLSVLVWFFAMAAFFMAPQLARGLVKYALLAMAAGTLLMSASFFDSNVEAYLSNYIPVITSPLFFAGLALVLVPMGVLALATLCAPREMIADYYHWGVRGVALIMLMSLVAFWVSTLRMPAVIDGEQYFEMLFWAGGHIWQFAFIALMMLAWLILIGAPARSTKLGWLMLGNTVLAAIGLYGVAAYEPSSMAHRDFFTLQMRVVGALAPALLGLYLLFKHPKPTNDLRFSLYASWVLFIAGGLISLTIAGQDTRIPAHYHGSVIAITVALMGVAFAAVGAQGKWVRWQPIIYCVGKLLHIGGLAVSGGYGALRKTPGTDSFPLEAKLAMGVMGMGALLSMIAGLVFVVIMVKMLRRNMNAQ